MYKDRSGSLQGGGSLARTLLVLLLALFTLSCGHAPVQEMSDARQAVEAAHAAGAEEYAPDQYRKARSLLESAESQLNRGRYEDAREKAARARDEAIQAREIAQQAEQEKGGAN